MAIGETTGASVPRAQEQEPIYEGEPGRTHLTAIHVPLPNGYARTVQVYDVVNVGTDPHLREPTLAGALHRFDSGEALAIPFVFHDPHARRLALVVPEVLRHEELALRAKLLTRLAQHADVSIPPYAREAKTVIGIAELTQYLSRAPEARAADLGKKEATLAQREAALAQRDAQLETRGKDLEIQAEALAQRESRLSTRAEQVTRLEDELREQADELEAARADLAVRERELEARLEGLVQREAEVASQRADSNARRLPSGRPPPSDLVAEVVSLYGGPTEADVVDVPDLDRLPTSPGEIAPLDANQELARAVEMVDDGPASIDAAEDVEEIVDDVEELEEVEPLPEETTGIHPQTDEDQLEEARTALSGVPSPRPSSVPPPPPSRSAPPPAPDGPPPLTAPPLGFTELRGTGASALVRDGVVWLFARVPESRGVDLYDDAPPQLLVQLVVIEECPVVLLSLVEASGSRPLVVRAPLDPRGVHRPLLEQLAQRFEVSVELYGSDGRYLKNLPLSAPREGNVERILERLSKMRTAVAVDVHTAIDRVLSAPPPVRESGVPFEREPLPADASARDVLDALTQLSRWSNHERLDHALHVLSIPAPVVDAAIRNVVERALDHGFAMPEFLTRRAVALGIADDDASLVTRQLERFHALSRSADHGGLSDDELAGGWEKLLKAAADAEVAIDADTHEHAWDVIRKVRGQDQGPSRVDPEKLPELGVPQLVMLLEHPRHRRDAAIELAKRKDAELVDKLMKAVRKMPRGEVARVVPHIVLMGDAVGDALIDGLSARKTFVRQAFALGLGHLRLRRSVVPLLHLLTAEESDVWREIARVIGSFGTASLRTVTRQLKDPRGREDRYALTLAYLANHGCEKQITSLTGESSAVAAIAKEALELRERAKGLETRIVGAAPLGADDPIAQFSQRFYAELEGRTDDPELDAAKPT
ncbi:MAG: hypothetical protein AB7S26_38320 [Sandaracinaceae bacterium]